ncbi:hypothetical protein SAMN05443549_101174 [Flavobacterium fluvii]|uniref:Uncharacterized protein n=1 Tax=Flavobacterium fluvii TaxID=468056 RepID=A0A1M5E323_9FLAO|nr:hypothetical protein SAMN05443549_101174 [Flavobacterium fluvii]
MVITNIKIRLDYAIDISVNETLLLVTVDKVVF